MADYSDEVLEETPERVAKFLNGIGAILTRPGEGLIGFNFRLQGPMGTARVSVNPLSVLTPGMFRELFRRPPPEVQ